MRGTVSAAGQGPEMPVCSGTGGSRSGGSMGAEGTRAGTATEPPAFTRGEDFTLLAMGRESRL